MVCLLGTTRVGVKSQLATGVWRTRSQPTSPRAFEPHNLQLASIRSNTVIYNAAITSCDCSAEWQRALSMLEDMRPASVPDSLDSLRPWLSVQLAVFFMR